VGDTHPGGIALIEKRASSGWVRVAAHVSGSTTLGGVAAVSDRDVWAVGANGSPLNDTETGPLIDHWNGSRWTVVTGPAVAHGYLDAVTALGPDDVWAVGAGDFGRDSLTEHFNGTSWSVVPSLNHAADTNILTGVAGTSADAVWAVGSATGGPLVEYWDGTDWRLITTPRQAPTPEAVTALSPSDVWAVGTGGLDQAMNWSGSRWQQVATPDVTSFGQLSGVAAAGPQDVWASVGRVEFGPPSAAENWNGQAWHEAVTPRLGGQSQANAITATPDGGALAVGVADSPGPHGAVWEVCPARVTSRAFQPAAVTDQNWLTVTWRAAAANRAPVTVRDDTGLGLFKSGSITPGATYTYRFYAAGTYSVGESSGAARQSVAVPLNTRPARGQAGSYQLTWAARAAPFGYVYDVRMKAPGASQFTAFRTGVSSISATFTPSAAGTYQFEARQRKSPGGAASGWSPPVSVSVTG
jgi:hypothetical protein